MVISTKLGSGLVRRILVDTGADSNIIFRNAFNALGFKNGDMKTHQPGVTRLGDHFIKLDGNIDLLVKIGSGKTRRPLLGHDRNPFWRSRSCRNRNLALRKRSQDATRTFLTDLDLRVKEQPRPKLDGDLEKVQIGNSLERHTFLNQNLPYKLKQKLSEFLRGNGDLFTFTPPEHLELTRW
ncbi:hypothetical protein PIB30_050429 [Stylosanthes scabra]|uniref:Peptidase A2 domain-containing protein n=1 Tax=Stylosanthes scabra TaxID=79078 RepID=A0ABU6ZGC7_9FABA|nr:hypothetical protein [Stylosanthes scabra]